MAGTFPVLSHGQPVRQGAVHRLEIRVKVQQFRSGTEQRYASSGLLNSFTLAYSRLPWADVAAIRDFWTTQKGAFDSTWQLTFLDPSAQSDRMYANLAFDSDELAWNETQQGRYDLSLGAAQTVAEAVTVSPGGDFPVIRNGVRVQLPFRSALRFRTERSDLDYGRRFAWAVWPAALRSWQLDYPVITDAEVKTLVDFYTAQGGPLHTFTFTDPNTNAAYTGCRFAPQPLELTRRTAGVNRLTLSLEQYKV